MTPNPTSKTAAELIDALLNIAEEQPIKLDDASYRKLLRAVKTFEALSLDIEGQEKPMYRS